MKRCFLQAATGAVAAVLALPAIAADVLPGATVSERALNGAKEYIEKNGGAENLKLTMLLSSLYRNSMPDFTREWTELTGVEIENVPLGYTDIPAKVMAEATAKTGVYDIFNDFPYSMPDAVGAGVVVPLDEYAARGQPDFSGTAPGISFQQYYQGKLYNMVLDGDHIILVLRKDLVENPAVIEEYTAKFGKAPGCPETMAEWEEMAAWFHTEEGQTRWGMTFENTLYGAVAYRSINFSYRHFPAYLGGLMFDADMNPTINTPNGIRAIKQFASIVQYMPPDVQGWGTPQIYPFWRTGNAFSAMSFPSIVGNANSAEDSVVKGKQLACTIPKVDVGGGKMVSRAPQAAGTGYMVNTYSAHPELAYWFIQWFTSESVGDRAIAHPKGFWDPFRTSNLTNEGIIARFGQQFLETTMENSKNAVSLLLLEGNYEYFNILDKHLASVMNGNITAEEAAALIEEGWNDVTEDIGRDYQIATWRSGVESGIYLDKLE